MRKFLIFTTMIFFLAACDGAGHAEDELTSAQIPSLLSGLRQAAVADFCGEPISFENPEVKERFEKEMLLILWDRPQVILWMKRAGRYMPVIEKLLKKKGVPEDLKYIAVIESALRPHAGSHRGAIGFWQFLKSTGKKYGLRIDNEIDQRRNIFAATAAAIRYFIELKQMFGSWTLAAAAYNMGEEGLRSEMILQKSENYYHLYLPLETQRFVFRAIAVKEILSNPSKYGFNMTSRDLYSPLSFDRVKIKLEGQTPIYLVAKAANSYFKRIKDLNPEIRGHYLGEGKHELLVPKGKGDRFAERFKPLYKQWRAGEKSHYYIVQKGDSLYSIADRFEVPIRILMIVNGLSASQYIHPGDRLLIYPDF